MYLKSIEVAGFKSFANKICLQFQPGITAIVGPNGSGKSNVADAVRWVLGEQRSKQLRGSSMQDVIFSGTEDKKAQSYAYVAITLDNKDGQLATEYQEVCVARRIYRSGESEYLINGSACRLRDVQELFYDTGIGKEGYSIIGQGQIDKILSGKPEERRELFDEAAGIVKFKRRKAQALAKLERQEQDRLRIQDVLGELERQIGPLTRQAQKAKTYLAYKEALKAVDIAVFLGEHGALEEKGRRLEGDLALAESGRQEAAEGLEEARQAYAQENSRLEEIQEGIDRLQEALAQEGQEGGRLQGQMALCKEQWEQLGRQAEEAAQRHSSYGREAGALEEEAAGRRQALAGQEALWQAAAGEMEAARTAWEQSQQALAQGRRDLEALGQEEREILARGGQLQSQLEKAAALGEQFAIQRAALQSQLVERATGGQLRAVQRREWQQALDAAVEEAGELEALESGMQERLGQYRQQLAALDGALRGKQGEYHLCRSRLEALTAIHQRYEGYGQSVKKLMEERGRFPGILGTVADVIHTDSRYALALETALGGSLQHIITKDSATAKALVQRLKEQKWGRATFLPLDGLSQARDFSPKQALEEPGVLGLASRLCQYAPQFEALAAQLLGRILVVDTMDRALAIARKYQHSLRMVTLEGELFSPGGAISGGAFKNSANLLGRRRELEALELSVREAAGQVEALEADIQAAKSARAALRRELEALQERQRDLESMQMSMQKDIDGLALKEQEEEARWQSLEAEEARLGQELGRLDMEKQKAREALEGQGAAARDLEERMSGLQAALAQEQDREARLGAQAAASRLEEQKLSLAREYAGQQLEQLEHRRQEALERAAEMEALHRRLEQEQGEKKARLAALEEEVQSQSHRKLAGEKSLSQALESREAAKAAQKRWLEAREERGEALALVEKECMRLSSLLERVGEQISQAVAYMWEEYAMTLRDARRHMESQPQEEDRPLAALQKEKARLGAEIKALGDVHVNAIEDLRELEERHGFLFEQHKDLEEGAKALAQLAGELDQAMRRQFGEQFGRIEREFARVFAELFGGGKAWLELEEGDALESGISIKAQPPGKKLQNMMQLSGGEKALTAISLLFAIQNLKPSPFCLLDEIEAALDESNVSRFAGYLHKLAHNTQFIVITHRRGTMERADRLYGITMQERGISALVSVNLVEKDLQN